MSRSRMAANRSGLSATPAATGATKGVSRKFRRMVALVERHQAGRVERPVNEIKILLGQAQVS